MQTIRRPQIFVVAPWVALLVLAAVVAACSSSGASPSGSPTGTRATPGPAAAGPLMTVESRGGECAGGPCGGIVVIERDGTVHAADEPLDTLGTLSAPQLTALDAAIGTTNFDLVKSRPFTGECPIAFDGQEFIFEFGTPNGVVRIASCETEVDYASPLFGAVAAAVAPYLPLPVP